jgi:hypothetical protein
MEILVSEWFCHSQADVGNLYHFPPLSYSPTKWDGVTVPVQEHILPGTSHQELKETHEVGAQCVAGNPHFSAFSLWRAEVSYENCLAKFGLCLVLAQSYHHHYISHEDSFPSPKPCLTSKTKLFPLPQELDTIVGPTGRLEQMFFFLPQFQNSNIYISTLLLF